MSESSAATSENFAILGASISIIKGKKPSVIYPNPLNRESRPYILIESFGRSYRQYTDDSSCKLAYEDDVLIVWDGERAGLTSHGHSGYIGSTLAAIRIADKSLVSKYLLYILEKERAQLRGSSEGTGVPHLSRWAVENINYFKPNEPEQTKIATILSSVDDVIEKTRAQIDKLKDLKTGIMQELLTQGIGHTEFKDSPVGRIPVEWKIHPLSCLSHKISDGIHSTPEYTENSQYYFINGNNLKDGSIFLGVKVKCVSMAEYLKHKKELGKNTILMSINGTIGNLAFYREETVILGKSAAFINLKEDYSKEFIYYALQSDHIKRFYDLELTGSTINNLSLSSIKKTLIPVPSKIEQIKIASILGELDKHLRQKNQKLDFLSKLKKALMQDLLTGKVRVNLDSPEVAAA